jgi:SAM-dependent methyltransferase
MTPSYGTASAWAAGPDVIYGALAEAALDRWTVRPGVLVLDAGCGTGALSRPLRARGARVVALDRSADMLTHGRSDRSLLGDVTALPLRTSSVDGAVAGFVVNHLPDPVAGLAELGRVTRAGGPVLATTFAVEPHPVKATVEAVLLRHGYRPPRWYVEFRAHAGLTGDADRLGAVGATAGLSDVDVRRVELDLTGYPAAALAGWRLGMAHTAPWLAARPALARTEITVAATAAVTALGPPPALPMLVLAAYARRSATTARSVSA